MSMPSFPGSGGGGGGGGRSGHQPIIPPHKPIFELPSGGSGNSLPIWLLICCGVFTLIATGVSVMSITLQLKSYRRPALQRAVVRIMVMVPLYAISSFIALYSLEAAFFIDAVRDLYEAFVIYTFFQLLITYLGGERSLLITLHGRPPIPHPFPVNIFFSPMDVSDPWTLLNLKRGILQYVQIKPLLVIATVTLKATGTYQEGRFAADSGYTYISIVYNFSICLSLYCLAMFWVAVNSDLKPFRPVPKFLCVKGILFFSFWQSIAVSFLVAVHAIKQVGPYKDAEHMSLALVDSLICFEMPIFAIAHQYAFQASDYIDETLEHCARLPFLYALRDAFGFKDVWEDTKDTIRGSGISYQTYEPAEGGIHYGKGRQKRIRAGLRYSKGGKSKYWLPIPGDEARAIGETGPLTSIKRKIDERLHEREGFAPLLPDQSSRVVKDDPHRIKAAEGRWGGLFDSDSDESDAPSLDFEDIGKDEEKMYDRARRIGYAGFPNVDVSKENKNRKRKEEEDGILAGKWMRAAGGRGDRPAGRDRSREGARREGAKTKNNRKGKERAGRVYGHWADRPSSSEPPDLLTPHEETFDGPDDGPVGLYDGDIERSGSHQDPDGSAEQLRWSKKSSMKGSTSLSTSPNPERLSTSIPKKSKSNSTSTSNTDSIRRSQKIKQAIKSPFALGSTSPSSTSDKEPEPEPVSDPDIDDPVSPANRALPSDAVDLVVEDTKAREEMISHERRKGEPQTKIPQHVYISKRSGSEMKIDKVQEDYGSDDLVANGDNERRDSERLNLRDEPVKKPEEIVQEMDKKVEEAAERYKGGGVNGEAWKWSENTGGGGYDHEDNPWK